MSKLNIMFMKKCCILVIMGMGIILLSGHAKAEGLKSIDDYLPGPLGEKLDIDVELRYRLEYRDNFDFNDNKDDKDGFHLFRTRINLSLDASKYLGAYVQLQDSRIWESQFSNKTPFENYLDVRQAYLDIKMPVNSNVSLRVGRQELSYGKQRLIGGFNWSNVAQSFDAVKIIYDVERFKIDLFASRKVIIESDSFDKWDEDGNIYGIYGIYKAVNKHEIHLYYLYRDADTGLSEWKESTIGLRLAGKGIRRFDYGLEAALQFGDFGKQDISAFALVALAGYTLELPWAPRIGIEWDHASGDEDPNDNERNTFDNLFPTNHIHYGYMDRASLQNLDNLRLTVNANPSNKLSLQTDLHFLRLAETSDSFYHAGRGVIRTATGTDVSNSVGTDFDLLIKYSLYNNIKLLMGYSHFFAGDYLKETGSDDDGDFFYFQTLLNF